MLSKDTPGMKEFMPLVWSKSGGWLYWRCASNRNFRVNVQARSRPAEFNIDFFQSKISSDVTMVYILFAYIVLKAKLLNCLFNIVML